MTGGAAKRDIAVDLPGTGQAAVVLAKASIARSDPRFYSALVANTVLGGGYSARLNDEIRVKRGLSYGAGSSLDARAATGLFYAQAQTRNEAAPQVASLMQTLIAGLAAAPASPQELEARKSSLVGEYGRALATADGLAGILGALAIHGADPGEIDIYAGKVDAVSAADVQAFARDMLTAGGDSLIVVGDAKVFSTDLKSALPDLEIIPLGRLDLDSPTLTSP